MGVGVSRTYWELEPLELVLSHEQQKRAGNHEKGESLESWDEGSLVRNDTRRVIR